MSTSTCARWVLWWAQCAERAHLCVCVEGAGAASLGSSALVAGGGSPESLGLWLPLALCRGGAAAGLTTPFCGRASPRLWGSVGPGLTALRRCAVRGAARGAPGPGRPLLLLAREGPAARPPGLGPAHPPAAGQPAELCPLHLRAVCGQPGGGGCLRTAPAVHCPSRQRPVPSRAGEALRGSPRCCPTWVRREPHVASKFARAACARWGLVSASLDWHTEALGVPSGEQSRAGDPRGPRSGRGSGYRSPCPLCAGGRGRLRCPSFSVLRVAPQTCLCGHRCLEPSPGLRSPPRPWSWRGWRPARGRTPLSTARSARSAAGPLASCGRRWTRRRIRRYWAPEGWGVWVLGGGSDAPHTLPPHPIVGRPGAFADHAACPCKPPCCLSLQTPRLPGCPGPGPLLPGRARVAPVATLLVAAGICHGCRLGRTAGGSVESRAGFRDFESICLVLCWH